MSDADARIAFTEAADVVLVGAHLDDGVIATNICLVELTYLRSAADVMSGLKRVMAVHPVTRALARLFGEDDHEPQEARGPPTTH